MNFIHAKIFQVFFCMMTSESEMKDFRSLCRHDNVDDDDDDISLMTIKTKARLTEFGKISQQLRFLGRAPNFWAKY